MAAKKSMTKGKKIVAKTAKKATVSKERQTRLDILRALAESTALRKTDVESVFQQLKQMIHAHLKKRGSGEFVIPMTGVKIKRVRKKPTKAREMISPLTNKKVYVKAKPSRPGLKIIALQTLKSALED